MLLWMQAAMAMDVEVTLAPGEGGVLSQTLRCTATDVKKGELLSLPAQQLGESQVVPMLEIGGVGPWGVSWLSALRISTAGDGEYPGLVSIAQPARVQQATPCAPGQTCTHTFDRREHSVLLSVTASGEAPGSAEPEELIWRTTSWYRQTRPIDCAAAN